LLPCFGAFLSAVKTPAKNHFQKPATKASQRPRRLALVKPDGQKYRDFLLSKTNRGMNPASSWGCKAASNRSPGLKQWGQKGHRPLFLRFAVPFKKTSRNEKMVR
jgi:hypothetical protein